MKKVTSGFLLAVLVMLNFSGCATFMYRDKATVVSATGTVAPVQIFEDGVPIYDGNLPATFSVRSDRDYTVIYTAADGNKRTLEIAEKFNVWFIGSLLVALLPAVIDVITGSVFEIVGETVLPISYYREITLGENIPYHPDLRLIGTVDDL